MRHNNTQQGLGLMEVVVGVSIIAAVLASIVFTFNLYFKAALLNTEKIQAIYLLEEGIEAMRYLRDDNWLDIQTLTTGTPYYLEFDSNSWQAVTTQSMIDDEFERMVILDDVYRRTSDNDIVASTSPDTKAIDPNITQVTVRVLWRQGTKSAEMQTYLSNLFE